MKFGIEVHPVEGWVEYSRLAERVGFDCVWFAADHSYGDSGSALMLLALKTRRVKLCAGGNSVYLRHPVLIASATALVDEISGGRAMAGLVSAGFEVTLKLGMRAEEPLARCREAVEVIRALWRGGPVNYGGRFFTLRDVEIPYKARSGIPVYLGTMGSKFGLVGELCDGAFTHGKSLGYVERACRSIAEGAARVGRDPKGVEIAVSVPFKIVRSAGEREAYRRALKPMMTALITGEYSMGWLDSLGFSVDEIRPIREARGGRRFEMVGDRLLDRLIDAFAIVGTREECIDQIEGLERAGVGQVIAMLEPLILSGARERKELVLSVGREMIPAFKE